MLRISLCVFGALLVPSILSAQSPEIEWMRFYGGSGYEGLRYAAPTRDGGFVAIGNSESADGDVSHHYGAENSNAWLVKLDKLGKLQWEKSLGGSSSTQNNNYTWGESVQQTSDGGFILAGGTDATGGIFQRDSSQSEAWVVKCDSLGHRQHCCYNEFSQRQ